ncbi:hypothetical protein [Nocardia sp. NPDC004260]
MSDTEPIDFQECRDRWGRGCTRTYDADGNLTQLTDGHGNVVPPEDWEQFIAYHHSAVHESWMEAAQEAAYYRQRALGGTP